MKKLVCVMVLMFTQAAVGEDTMASEKSELQQFAEFYASVHPLHNRTTKPREPRREESLQFDFIIGDFDGLVKTYSIHDGSPEGTFKLAHRSYYTDEKRMVINELTYSLEDEPGVVVGYGMTLCTYSEASGKWATTFLPSGNASSQVATAWWENSEMHQSGGGQLPNGGTLIARAKFFDIKANSFQWKQEFSLDEGQTWHLEQTQSFKRRKP